MTDTARLRELEQKATSGPWKAVNGTHCGFAVNEKSLDEFALHGFGPAQELAEILNAHHEERDALKAENERMRAVVEAARVIMGRYKEGGWFYDTATLKEQIKETDALDDALAAMEQNDE